MKIVFTGGHHNSSLAVAEILSDKGHKIFWFGHKTTMSRDTSLSAEYLEIKKYGFSFYELKTGKFYKTYNPVEYLKILFGFFQSLWLLLKIRPKLIVSFGGYLSAPVVLAGFCLGIPAVTHEQTSQAGLANQIIAPLVKKVFVAWPSSLEFFPKDKTNLVGLPLRPAFFKARKKAFFKNNLPTVFIVGGKQGSHIINAAVEQILKSLLKKYNLIHQTGRIKKTGDLKRLRKKRSLLSYRLKKRYILKPYFFGQKMVNCLSSADLVVSRAGAHIIYELAFLAKPAILIPIPWSYKNEQVKNALVLKKSGGAMILAEKEFNGKSLLTKIDFCFKNLEKLKNKASQAKKLIKKDASQKIAVYIEKNY